MSANALLNNRRRICDSDLYLYDLIHPLFLDSMGEMGIENLVLAAVKEHPGVPDKELISKSGVSRGTFYKYKEILKQKSLIN